MTPKEAIVAWRRYEKVNDVYEKRASNILNIAIKQQIKPLLQYITPDATLEYLQGKVDQVVKREVMELALAAVYKTIGAAQANAAWEELAAYEGEGKKSESVSFARTPTLSVSFRSEAWVRQMQNYALAQAGNKVAGIDRRTKDIIRQTLAEGYSSPSGHKQRARELKRALNDPEFTYRRAKTIARTETTAAASFGHMTAARSSTILLEKFWIPAAQPGRTRESHLAMLGSPGVDLEGKFIVGGEEMDRPGDPDASGKNVINCRCSVATRPKRDKDGRIMRKPAVGSVLKPQAPAIQVVQEAVQEAVNQAVVRGTYREAASIAEANAIGEELGLAKSVDYSGLKIDVANQISRTMFELQEAFPELKKSSNFLGSIQERDKRHYEAQVKEIAERYRSFYPDMSESERYARAKKMVKRSRVESGVVAQSAKYNAFPQFDGISLNSLGNYKGATVQDFKAIGVKAQSVKWWSMGADTGLTHTIAHETGHELDKLVGMLRKDPEFLAIYRRSVSQGRDYVADNLSRYAYAGRDPSAEFIAESFAEYWTMGAANARPLAKEIAELLIRRYNLKFKK